MDPPPPDAGGLRPPQHRSRVFWNTEPLLRNGERKVSDEFSLRPTRDPSARRRKLTPDAKRPSCHPRLRRPKGALCSPIVRHGFANQHEAQTGTVPVHFGKVDARVSHARNFTPNMTYCGILLWQSSPFPASLVPSDTVHKQRHRLSALHQLSQKGTVACVGIDTFTAVLISFTSS